MVASRMCQAVSGLCDAAPLPPPEHGTAYGALRPLLAAALLADGSPRALDALARLESEPVRCRGFSGLAPPGPPPLSLGLDVGLLLARVCQLPWPVMTTDRGSTIFASGHDEDARRMADCAQPARGWSLRTERPFPAESVLASACRPGGALALALGEARAAALAESDAAGSAGRGGRRRRGRDDRGQERGGQEGAEGGGDGGGGEDDGDDDHDQDASFADVAELGGPWDPDEDNDDDPSLGDPSDAPVAWAGARQWTRLLLGARGVLARPPRRRARAFPGDTRPRDPPRPLASDPPRQQRPGAVHSATRPHPYGTTSRPALAPAVAAAVQARGGEGGGGSSVFGLVCAALMSHRGRRALVDAEAAWRTWATDGGDGGEAGDLAADGPLLTRASPSAPPVTGVADLRARSHLWSQRGAELAPEFLY
jgi:hypothetical protein